MKHTPGPWKFSQCFLPNGIIETKSRKPICEIRVPHTAGTMSNSKPIDRAKSNGYLIAAAPDLLRELEKITDELENQYDVANEAGGCMDRARKQLVASAKKTIRKAKGE